MTLPPRVAEKIREAVARAPNEGGIDTEASGHGAIALMGTLGAVWMLRPDGTFWDADAETERALTALPEELHIPALVYGTDRFPWLAELLPPKPLRARTCSICRGSGFVTPRGVFCRQCRALGWEVEAPTGSA